MPSATELSSFWLCCVLAVVVGTALALLDDSPPHQGTGPVSHIDGCLDSALLMFNNDFWGLGLLDPLRQTFATRPEGVEGLGGLLAVFASFFAALGGVASAAYAAFCSCRGRRQKKEKHESDSESKVPESTTHEKVQLRFSEEMLNYWGYVHLIASGVFREYLVRVLASLTGAEVFRDYVTRERWNSGWVDFYKNHCYTHIEPCLHRPISSAPDAVIDVVKLTREGGFLFGPLYRMQQDRSQTTRCLNLSSYNYLGFGGVDKYCTPVAKQTALEIGFCTSAPRSEGGTVTVHHDLEKQVAKFLDKEDAIVLGMGFATNSTILPALFEAQAGGAGVLVLSDALNHRSIVEGIRLSGATVRAFGHNSMVGLEEQLREAVTKGQDGAGKPWRKIFIVVEGIYSMEGDFCRLREIVALKKKYKAYLYLDEAHSIGAVGPRGRGVTDLLGVPTSEVDIMMGTFTKSFGSAGGYVAASRDVIAALRSNAPGMLVACAMAPPCAAQALAALRVISGQEGGETGAQKLTAIRENSNLFRKLMEAEGFKVLGDYDSPIVPVMIHHSHKLRSFSDMCTEKGIAVVVVGYPVVPLLYERARFCISAAHTAEQIRQAVADITDIGGKLGILFEKKQDPLVTAERRIKDEKYGDWLHSAPLDIGAAPEAEAWTPEALVPAFAATGLTASLHANITAVNEVAADSDFRRHDLLGYGSEMPAAVKDAIVSTMDHYGFGACGPRGFYGGTLPHHDLEAAIASFLEMPACIVYSSGVVTASSVLPALIQANDRVILDEDVHMGVRAGLRLTKGEVSWYRQGDIAGLESTLISLESKDKERSQQRPSEQKGRKLRTFIFAEGVSQRTGRVAPLLELLRLKEKYGAMLILDESLSLPTMGATGRGLCEHVGAQHTRVDALIGSLEHGLANVGGFCAGGHRLVEHQRLAGAGYCYSASAPPSSCSAVTATLKCIDTEDGAARLLRLRQNTAKLHEVLRSAAESEGGKLHFELTSHAESPVQHLRWIGKEEDAEARLLEISARCSAAGVPVQVCSPAACKAEASFNKRIAAPPCKYMSLRAFASSAQSSEQISSLGSVLGEALLSAAAGEE